MSDSDDWYEICTYWAEEHGPEDGCKCPCHDEEEP